jgi:hypothetical protein
MQYWIWLLLFFSTFSVFGQVWVPRGTQGRAPSSISYDAGISQFNGDSYLYINPNIAFNNEKGFGLSLSLPVNLLIQDKSPSLDNSKTGASRYFDYDHKSDYFRPLNYIWYGNFGERTPGKLSQSFYMGRIIDGRIGNGTIVNHYINNSRFDIYNAGVIADINHDMGGVEVFLSSVYTREVGAVRGFIRPLAIGHQIYNARNGTSNLSMLQVRGKVIDEIGRKKVREEIDLTPKPQKESTKTKHSAGTDSMVDFAGRDPWYNRFTLGYTTAVDTKAPSLLDYTNAGIPIIDDSRTPESKETKRLTVSGIDVNYRILNLKNFELSPYADFNKIQGLKEGGKGNHYGVMFRVGNRDINAIIKPEFRLMDPNYIPMYFDSFYEINRYQQNVGSDVATTKYQELSNINPYGPKLSGYYHSLTLNFHTISFQISIEDYKGSNNSRVFTGLFIPLGANFTFSTFYTKRGFDKNSDAFKVDDKSQGAVEVGFNLGSFIIKLQGLRRYYFTEDVKGFDSVNEVRLLTSGGMRF